MESQLRPKEDQNIWNALLSALFAVLLGLSIWYVYTTHGVFPSAISLFDALLISLATFRITRLVVYDKITRFFREWFVQKKEINREGLLFIELTPYKNGILRSIHDLLQCPWCIGVWVALVVVFCYSEFPWTWYVVFVLAVAGVGSLMQIIANFIGWKAELAKLKSLEKGRAEEGKC